MKAYVLGCEEPLGKIKLNVQLDFGFGDVVVPEPMWIDLPDLLGMGAPRLLGYTRESAIAEKFQALVALDILNTRIKDFYDIWSLSRGVEFEGAILARAIAATFARRATPLAQQTPRGLTEEFSEDPTKQALWRAFAAREGLMLRQEARPGGNRAGSVPDAASDRCRLWRTFQKKVAQREMGINGISAAVKSFLDY